MLSAAHRTMYCNTLCIILSIIHTLTSCDGTIDVIIPCAPKDQSILALCIAGIRTYGQNIGRIIVVSAEPLTDQAEWFDQKRYPFAPRDIAEAIFTDPVIAHQYQNHPQTRIGWIYQQLLKLYAPIVIPNISPIVLILDADTIFLRPVEFITPDNLLLYTPGTEYHAPYFEHMKRLLPTLGRVFPHYSGIANHMLFERTTIIELLSAIATNHNKEPWRAICSCIDHKAAFGSCLSEYEIYFNFIFSQKKQVAIRPLKWLHQAYLTHIAHYQKEQYDYISCHSYLQ